MLKSTFIIHLFGLPLSSPYCRPLDIWGICYKKVHSFNFGGPHRHTILPSFFNSTSWIAIYLVHPSWPKDMISFLIFNYNTCHFHLHGFPKTFSIRTIHGFMISRIVFCVCLANRTKRWRCSTSPPEWMESDMLIIIHQLSPSRTLTNHSTAYALGYISWDQVAG